MYQKTELSNGIRILTEKLEHFKSVSLGIWVGTGSRDEDERLNGISHFIEHMIFKGTPRRDTLLIAKELDAIGGLSNAFTGKENTCFHSRVLDKHFPTLAEILSDIFLNSIFNPDDIERERQVILQEINMIEDSPEEQVHELFSRQFFSNHPLGMSVLGSSDTIGNIERDAILDYMSGYYSPDRIVIAAAGNIEHNEVVDAFEMLFKGLKPVEKKDKKYTHEIDRNIQCYYKELEQANICVGAAAPSLLSEKRYAAAILNTILGGNMSSKLFQEVREKRGLAYSIYSYLSAYMDAGIFGISAGTDPREVNNVLDVISNEILKIQEGNLSENDLQSARDHIIGSIMLGSENTDSRMMRLAKNEFVFGRYVEYEELIANLEQITLKDVIDCMKESFAKKNITITTLGAINREDLRFSPGSIFS